jgi:fatty acid amide hydrolase
MASELWEQSATELAGRIARGEVSALAVVEAHIARLEAVDPALHALVVKRYDAARAEARLVDERRARGERLPPLAGVPITVKECLDLEGTPSTFGLPSRQGHRAGADDVYVARLRRAGAIVLGKTNVAQLLLFLETENPLYGRTQHPLDAERTPGGSSGGQAAIVAAGGSPIGLGTDLGGSNRVPAAFCGVAGLKPTTGRTDDPGRYSAPFGQRAIVSQVGVFGRRVADARVAYEIIAEAPAAPEVDVARLRVGVWRDDGTITPSAAYGRALDEAVAALRARGVAVVEFAPPAPAEALELFYRVMSADGGKGLARTLGKDPRDPRIQQILQAASAPAALRPIIKWFLRRSGRAKTATLIDLYGHHDTDAYWTVCERIVDYEARWRRAMDEAAGGPLDALLSPAAALPAVRHGATAELGVIGAYTCVYNLLGWPAGVVPVTTVRPGEECATPRGTKDVADRTAAASERGSAGLPIAVQVAARPWREDVAFAVLEAIEAAVRAANEISGSTVAEARGRAAR